MRETTAGSTPEYRVVGTGEVSCLRVLASMQCVTLLTDASTDVRRNEDVIFSSTDPIAPFNIDPARFEVLPVRGGWLIAGHGQYARITIYEKYLTDDKEGIGPQTVWLMHCYRVDSANYLIDAPPGYRILESDGHYISRDSHDCLYVVGSWGSSWFNFKVVRDILPRYSDSEVSKMPCHSTSSLHPESMA